MKTLFERVVIPPMLKKWSDSAATEHSKRDIPRYIYPAKLSKESQGRYSVPGHVLERTDEIELQCGKVGLARHTLHLSDQSDTHGHIWPSIHT